MSSSCKSQHSEHELLVSAMATLKSLLDSSALDLTCEANDCLEVFQDYVWEMVSGGDQQRFDYLKDRGNAGTMTSAELNEFMGLVSDHGQTHLYFHLVQGHRLLRLLRSLHNSSNG